MTPIQAFRAAIRAGFEDISSQGKEAPQGRMKLMLSVPELHTASLLQLNDTLKLFAAIVSERAGRPENDFEVLYVLGRGIGSCHVRTAVLSGA